MKKAIILFFLSTIFLVNVSANEDAISKAGEAIFQKKGCVLCHKLNVGTIGPSLLDLSMAYRSSMGELVLYLTGQREPIVEPARASVMNPQLVKIKALSDENIKAVAVYIMTRADRPAVDNRKKIKY